MEKEVKMENTMLKEKALDRYYTDELKLISTTLSEWREGMKKAQSWVEHDSYAISSNHLMEKRIAIAFEAAQKFTDPSYRKKFYFDCLKWGIPYYEIKPASVTFKFLHPRVSQMFKNACKGYAQAVNELIESKRYDPEVQLDLMTNVVFFEKVERSLSFSIFRRS